MLIKPDPQVRYSCYSMLSLQNVFISFLVALLTRRSRRVHVETVAPLLHLANYRRFHEREPGQSPATDTGGPTVDQAMEEAVRIANANAAIRYAGKPLAIKAENLTRIYKIRAEKKDKKKEMPLRRKP